MKMLCFILIPFLGCSNNATKSSEPHDKQAVQIYLKWNTADVLDTFHGELQKDLVMDGTVRIRFWLTKREQEIILITAERFRFFSYPDTVNRQPDEQIEPDPGPQVFRIKTGNRDKSIVWFEPHDKRFKYYQLLMQLRNLVVDIVASRPEYRALPESRGGYF